MRKLHQKSPWLKRLSLMAAMVPFALIWGEMFTRELLPQNVDSKMNIFEADSVVGFIYKPLSKTYEKGKEYNALYEINSLGLRDREYGIKKGGIFRVLLLGDSFSVSHGLSIEDSLSRQMERALQEVADSDGRPVRIEVINVAAGGYSPYNYRKAYHRWAPVFDPDAVLVGLSPDDFDCDNENARYLIENGEILGVSMGGQVPEKVGNVSSKKLRKWLSWNSEFYILMRNFFYYSDLVGRIIQWENPGGVGNNTQLQGYMVSNRGNIHKMWAKSFDNLQKLKKDTTANGVTMVLMPIPLKMEIDPEQYRQILASQGLNNEQLDIDQPLREISAFCKKENIPVLDPRPALRKRHAEVPCYFVYDGHWIAGGIRAATVSAAIQWHALGLPPFGNASNICLRK